MRILIVEDETNTRKGIGKLILAYSGHEVVGEAKNGEEGYEMAKKMRPDLIITDIRMPKMSGLEMMEKLYHDPDGNYDDIFVVILSGYADFDYARRAIFMNGRVLDYLLKPIDMEKIIKGMENWEIHIRNKRMEQNRPEQVLKNVLLGNVEMNDEVLDKLRYICKIEENTNSLLFWIYKGGMGKQYEEEVKKRLRSLQEEKRYCGKTYLITEEREKSLICFMTDVKEEEKLIAEIQKKEIERYNAAKEHPVWAMGTVSSLHQIQRKSEEVRRLMAYGILYKKGILLTEEIRANYHVEKFLYPYEIEKQLKVAVCSENREEIEKGIKRFAEYVKNHQFDPIQIKQGYRKLLSFIQDLSNEMNIEAGRKIEQNHLLFMLEKAVLWEEIETICSKVTDFFGTKTKEKNTISNYVILKAIAYIREHYQEGITLDEVARKLEITPEYLSALFSREMNINFTAFVKEFRISHAKRLLKGTNLKIYEVAQEVGYQDPKYFNRVFKEVEGISPGDYRGV